MTGKNWTRYKKAGNCIDASFKTFKKWAKNFKEENPSQKQTTNTESTQFLQLILIGIVGKNWSTFLKRCETDVFLLRY